MTSHAIRLELDDLEADARKVRVALARSADADEIGALCTLQNRLRVRRKVLLERHAYAVARELADLMPHDNFPAKAQPSFGAHVERKAPPFHTNWRNR
jgi:hypothetical protein